MGSQQVGTTTCDSHPLVENGTKILRKQKTVVGKTLTNCSAQFAKTLATLFHAEGQKLGAVMELIMAPNL
jgi:hypothetical protein